MAILLNGLILPIGGVALERAYNQQGYPSLDNKSQIVGWLVTHGSKWCVYTKSMFCQNFRIFEKKLAEGSAYLVYNVIYKSQKT